MLIAAAAVALPAGPAWGQSGGGSGCGGGSGLNTADVNIDEPAPNSVVSGQNVVVRGDARVVSLGPLSRVEVSLAGMTKVHTASPSSSINFEVSFDVTNVPPGETSLQVVACGAFSLAGSLARGEAEITVRVQATAASTSTSVPRTTTTGRSQGNASAAAGAATTTSVAVTTTTRAGQAATAGSSTTVTAAPGPGAESAAPAPAQTDPVRPRASDAPLILTESDDDDSDSPPRWVGAVVGVSGGLGLLFSATSSRRRSRLPEAAEPLEPSDTDLVDVR